MSTILKQHYGTTEGPLGFPMSDRSARALEEVIRTLPSTREYEYRHLVSTRGPTEVNPGERSDVSWISTESVDRTGEVVRARGMDDSHFQMNPMVTWQHAYHLPPVGRSLWRRRSRDGDLVGIKAKTLYPHRPESWNSGEDWPPDRAFALVSTGLLNGKSIGFLPTRVHVPDEEEARRHGWDNVQLVIDNWLLLEYACCFLPVNQDALVQAVAKGLHLPTDYLTALGVKPDQILVATATPQPIPFTPLREVQRHVQRRLEGLDLEELLANQIRAGIERMQGRI